MAAMTVPLWAAALLAALAATGKVRDAQPARDALRAAGWPHHPALVRGGALAALVLSAATLAVGGRLVAAALAVTYLALTGFVLRLRRRQPDASCGCFGAASAPADTGHAVLTAALAAAAAAAAVRPVPGAAAALSAGQPVGPVVLAGALAAALTAALLVAFTAAPAARSAAAGLRSAGRRA